MNQVQTFDHKIFGKLPVLVVDGVEWFGATEAARALSFSDPHKAITNHVDEDDSTVRPIIDSLGRKQHKKFINESGLYSLIFGAAKQGNNPEIKEKAKQFKRWVTAEVLPTIRKHGAYMTPETIEQVLTDPDTIIKLATTLKEERQKRIAAEKQLEEQKPQVLFANAVETSESSVLIGELAKILRQNGVDIGQNRLFEWLRNNGYLIKQKGENYNLPTQYSMDLGLFEIKKRTINNPDGSVRVTRTPKVTGKGQIYFVNKFLENRKSQKTG